MHVDLTHLATFVAVVQHGSMTTASTALPCAVSTVSSHCAQLERRLDVQLLRRDADGCTPTATGVLVARRASEILDLHARMVTEARLRAGPDLPSPRAGWSEVSAG